MWVAPMVRTARLKLFLGDFAFRFSSWRPCRCLSGSLYCKFRVLLWRTPRLVASIHARPVFPRCHLASRAPLSHSLRLHVAAASHTCDGIDNRTALFRTPLPLLSRGTSFVVRRSAVESLPSLGFLPAGGRLSRSRNRRGTKLAARKSAAAYC